MSCKWVQDCCPNETDANYKCTNPHHKCDYARFCIVMNGGADMEECEHFEEATK